MTIPTRRAKKSLSSEESAPGTRILAVDTHEWIECNLTTVEDDTDDTTTAETVIGPLQSTTADREQALMCL